MPDGLGAKIDELRAVLVEPTTGPVALTAALVEMVRLVKARGKHAAIRLIEAGVLTPIVELARDPHRDPRVTDAALHVIHALGTANSAIFDALAITHPEVISAISALMVADNAVAQTQLFHAGVLPVLCAARPAAGSTNNVELFNTLSTLCSRHAEAGQALLADGPAMHCLNAYIVDGSPALSDGAIVVVIATIVGAARDAIPRVLAAGTVHALLARLKKHPVTTTPLPDLLCVCMAGCDAVRAMVVADAEALRVCVGQLSVVMPVALPVKGLFCAVLRQAFVADAGCLAHFLLEKRFAGTIMGLLPSSPTAMLDRHVVAFVSAVVDAPVSPPTTAFVVALSNVGGGVAIAKALVAHSALLSEDAQERVLRILIRCGATGDFALSRLQSVTMFTYTLREIVARPPAVGMWQAHAQTLLDMFQAARDAKAGRKAATK